jgi:hypothetical protein
MRGKSLDTAECADQFTALKSKLTNRVNHIGWPPQRGAGGWRGSVRLPQRFANGAAFSSERGADVRRGDPRNVRVGGLELRSKLPGS